MNGPRDYYPEWNKSDKQILSDIAYMWNIKKGTNELIYETESELLMVTK